MGWYPTEIKNTLKENLTSKFWKDLQKHLDGIKKHNKALCKKHKVKEEYELPDDVDVWSYPETYYNYESYDFDLDDIKNAAFNSDHMEHIAAWLWDKEVWPLFEKHKVNGEYVLHHKDGGGFYHGICFKDGLPYDAKVSIKILKGKKLK